MTGAQRLYIRLRVEQLSQTDKKPEVQTQPPQQAVRAAVQVSKPEGKIDTPKSASSDASAKPADETKPKKKGFLYRIAQSTSILIPLHFIGGVLFYASEKHLSFNAWDHITGQMWMGYLAFPFAVGYWLYQWNLANEDEKTNNQSEVPAEIVYQDRGKKPSPAPLERPSPPIRVANRTATLDPPEITFVLIIIILTVIAMATNMG